MIRFVVTLLTLLASVAHGASWFDDSHRVLVPTQVNSVLQNYQNFPVFWWNFLVLEGPTHQEPDWDFIESQCFAKLSQRTDLVQKVFCGPLSEDMLAHLHTWVADYPLRHALQSKDELERLYDRALAKASLPIGPQLIQVLRVDPFDALTELRQIALSKNALGFEQKGSFFFDPQTHRIAIPVQMKYPPTASAKTAEFISSLSDFCRDEKCTFKALIGPHGSTFENEHQIRRDVEVVSSIGWIVMSLFVVWIFLSRRRSLLWCIPPILVSIGLAIGATVVVFGSIHGLTLAFGPGIVGLALDYGMHGAFTSGAWRATWRANLFGLLTTLAVLIVMGLSQLPILRQLMFFSVMGLISSYALLYFMHLRFPDRLGVRPLKFSRLSSSVFSGVAYFWVVLSVWGMFTAKLNLDIRQLNYQSPDGALIAEWIYTSGKMKPPLIQISKGDENSPLESAHEQMRWATQSDISVESAAKYLPPLETQKAHLKTWRGALCASEKSDLVKKFFEPFWRRFQCQHLEPHTLLASEPVPYYVSDFNQGHDWVSVWFPHTDEQIKSIRQRYPDVMSIADTLTLFPKTLAAELAWMAPAALLASYLLMLYFFRRFDLSLIALIPFFSGLGCYIGMMSLFHWSMSFITVMGLIMVFGFSLDYGMFATNIFFSKLEEQAEGVWSALTLAALTTFIGFVPLVFAHHPVLLHLGQSLATGTLGAYIGATCGIPFAARLRSRSEE